MRSRNGRLNGSRLLLLVLWVGITTGLALTQNVEAATLKVSPTGQDTGNCQSASCKTIKYAVSQASDGDTVDLSAGTYTEADICVNKNLTISGAGDASTIVQAAATPTAATSRVFKVDSSVTATLEKMTIRYGRYKWGGGIFVDTSATLTINDATITENTAPDPGFGGGILLNSSATLTLKNSKVTKNTVKGNSGVGGAGGGIFAYCSTTATISNSTISDNESDWGGAGIEADYKLTIDQSTISGNLSHGNAGGIFASGDAQISRSSVVNNYSGSRGGGIYNGSTMTVADTLVSKNTAWAAGSGIFNDNGATLKVLRSTISNHIGDGITQDGTATIINSTISGNESGGGTSIGMSSITSMINSTVANNIANYYSPYGVSGWINGTLYAKNTIIANNLVPDGTGGNKDSNCSGVTIHAYGVNYSTDNTCTGFTQVTKSQLKLGSLMPDLISSIPTHALLTGSVAIDAVSDCTDLVGVAVATDQRSVARPQPVGGKCDAGAYEVYSGSLWLPLWPDHHSVTLVKSPDGGASIYFPPDSVPGELLLSITVKQEWNPPVPPPPPESHPLGRAYLIEAFHRDGSACPLMDGLIEVSLLFDPAELENPEELRDRDVFVYVYDVPEERWLPMESFVDHEARTVTARTERFGLFAIFVSER
jgi:hypothetical protein